MIRKSNLPTSCPAFVVLLFVQSVCNCSGTLSPMLMANGAADSDKTGSYIVVLKEDTTHERFMAIKSQVVTMTEDGELHGSVEAVVKAFTVKLSGRALSIVRSIPEVYYVEEETMVRGTQNDSVIWHVDRLDQYHLPLDNSYQPNGTGEGVDIYILDTGVKYDHEEFEGRAEYGGYDPIDIAACQNLRGNDCNGHGTHVASLAAGKTYGTAKKARIYSIRVLGCTISGYLTRIIEGLDYVYRIIPERGRPAVVSMSFISYYSYTTDIAIKRLYNQNITMVAAAGNSRSSACYVSPARSPNVITVAGSAMDDGIYHYTNAGPCVDIFAPGSMIEAADYTCVSCSEIFSGTSMAAPKVSGVAAIHLEKDPTLNPDQIKEMLTSTATPDVLNFTDLPYYYRSSTPNRLLYIGPFDSVSIDCEEPPNITNGDVSFTDLIPGSIATYSCVSGYTLLGAANQTCNFLGKWSYKEPKCVISCPEVPYRIPNGYSYDYRYYFGYHYSNLHLEGSIVRYRCFYGYLLLGDSRRTCQANGTWSGEEPQCVAQCPRLLTITKGNIRGYLGNRTEDTIVTYSCIKGYTLVGPVQRICQSNRTWSGHQPSCVLVPPPSEVQALCSVIVWDSPDALHCNNLIGYDVRLFGSPQLQQNLTKRVRSNRTYYVISDEDNLANSYETYVQVRTVFVDVAGEWSEGISLGCDQPIVVPEKCGVYFKLNGKIYQNNSAVRLTDIRRAGSALICKTDKEDCCKTLPNRYGEFYYPNGERVPIKSLNHGFYRNRDEQLIRLNRRKGTTSPPGKYRCEIPDSSGELKNIYITLKV